MGTVRYIRWMASSTRAAAALRSKYRDGCGVGITDISVTGNSFEIVLAHIKLMLTSSFSRITLQITTLTLAHSLTLTIVAIGLINNSWILQLNNKYIYLLF